MLEHPSVAVSGVTAEKVTVVVTFGLECGCSAVIGHDPVVVGLFGVLGSIVEFGNMSEDAQRLGFSSFYQSHAGMVFPGSQRIVGLLRGIVILLIDKSA